MKELSNFHSFIHSFLATEPYTAVIFDSFIEGFFFAKSVFKLGQNLGVWKVFSEVYVYLRIVWVVFGMQKIRFDKQDYPFIIFFFRKDWCNFLYGKQSNF